jgi:four helix bundle suffix protein
MVQAARSGVQNIAEGSQASGTSKKTEIKLTNVARASLEELKLDFEDFLRQNGFPIWPFNDLRRQDLIDRRIKTVDEFALWAKQKAVENGCEAAECAANGMIILIFVACKLLDRQLIAQAEAFQKEGGFTERLYKTRIAARKNEKWT